MKEVKIIDNFLEQDDFEKLSSSLLSQYFPWYWINYKVGPSNNVDESHSLFDQQFVHMFYSNYTFNSSHCECIDSLLRKINPCAILKIKANLTTCTKKIVEFPFHTDERNFNGITGIFYLNSNNGYTEFESGDKIESVANRFVSFDADLLHRGTTATDTKLRAVINLNYFPWTEV